MKKLSLFLALLLTSVIVQAEIPAGQVSCREVQKVSGMIMVFRYSMIDKGIVKSGLYSKGKPEMVQFVDLAYEEDYALGYIEQTKHIEKFSKGMAEACLQVNPKQK